ncbi:MAG: PA14 domain-containing protein [Candidatus Howiella sp.]|jgi:hypothetical protein
MLKKNVLCRILSLGIVSLLLLGMWIPVSAEETVETGLWAEYYSGTGFETYVTGGVSEQIHFEWSGSPMAGVPAEHYSIRWTGRIQAPTSGSYIFTTSADDGVKVLIDGKQIISDPGPHGATNTTGWYEMEAGRFYSLVIEYYNGYGGGGLSLYWQTTGMDKTLVPAENLFLPEYEAAVSLTYSETGEKAAAHLLCDSDAPLVLVLEKRDLDGNLVDTFEAARPAGQNIWEVEDVLSEEKDYLYTAVVQDAKGNAVSAPASGRYGVDYALEVAASEKAGEVSDLLYGACMEDVNHELYGGIWSQMIFGESFAEPNQVEFESAFTVAAGQWMTDDSGEEKLIYINRESDGPKLTVNDSECTSGSFSADVWFDGEAAGFIVKTSDAKPGADSFNGYEISLLSGGAVRIAKHQYNYNNLGDTPCAAVAAGRWINLRVDMTENSITVYVDGNKAASYTDSNPISTGLSGLRAWNSTAKFKNIKYTADSGAEQTVEIPTYRADLKVSGMWRGVVTGSAEGTLDLFSENAFKDGQSQRITMTGGEGTIGISNKGLNRKGMNIVDGKDYEGYFYAKSDTAIDAYVSFVSADGATVYAKEKVSVSGDWSKYSFALTPDGGDTAGQLVIEIAQPGTLDLGYVFLQPGEWGRYKGLSVRKDVGELLENQGITVLRFGGCMANASEYRWKDMVGAPEERRTYRGWWYTYSSFGFGIIEFLDLCDALGVAAVPDFNSYESPEDMADFIQFATGTDPSNEWVQLRISMGREEPYDLPYLQIGNEERIDAAFAERFNAIANAVWALDTDITLIAGDFDYKDIITDPYNFTGSASGLTTLANHKTILDNAVAHGMPVWFDIHFWSENGTQPYSFIHAAISLYDALRSICPDAEFAFPVFELNAASHDFERALCNAFAINNAERISDIIPIVCSANCLQVDGHNDNGWDQGLIFMDNDSAWYQAPAYMDILFGGAHQPYLLTAEGLDIVNTQNFDVTLTGSEDGGTVCVKIVNRTGEAKNLGIAIPEFAGYTVSRTAQTYTAGLKDTNTSENPENIVPQAAETSAFTMNAGGIVIATEGYSVSVVTLVRGEKAPDVKLGDLDGDGSVTVSDVVELRQIIVSGSQTAQQMAAGDINKDKLLTVSDVVDLRKMIVAG